MGYLLRFAQWKASSWTSFFLSTPENRQSKSRVMQGKRFLSFWKKTLGSLKKDICFPLLESFSPFTHTIN